MVGHGSTQESACGQTGQGRDSQVRSSVLERDKAALDVRGQQAIGQREQQGRGRRRGMTGGQYNGGEGGHTQEVLKLEKHCATWLMGCRKRSLRCRGVALVDER